MFSRLLFKVKFRYLFILLNIGIIFNFYLFFLSAIIFFLKIYIKSKKIIYLILVYIFVTFSVFDFFLSKRRNIFTCTAKIDPWQIFQLSIFVLSRQKYHHPSQRRNFRFFSSYFVLLPHVGNFERHCLLEIRLSLCFKQP